MKKRHKNIRLPPIDATDSLGFVSLMFAELIQALGGLLSIRWVANGVSPTVVYCILSSGRLIYARQFITEDSLCTAQGHLKQIGDVGVALLLVFFCCLLEVTLIVVLL